MKIKSLAFMAAACFCCMDSFGVNGWLECSSSNTPGQYCHNTTSSYCPEGCYCPGTGGYTAYTAGGVEGWCKNRGGLNNGGFDSTGTILASCVYLCPKEYPNSESGKSSISSCYTTCSNDTKVYYHKEITVPAGQYLEACKEEPTECNKGECATLKNTICPGAGSSYWDAHPQFNIKSSEKTWWMRPETWGMRGCIECPEGTVPNEKRTECVKLPDSVTCEAGEYLPKGKYACEPCVAFENDTPVVKKPGGLKSNEYCPAGTYKPSQTKDSKAETCPTGQTPNDDRSGCSACDDGEYADKTTGECKPCDAGTVPNDTGTGCKKCPKGQAAVEGRCVAEEEAPLDPIDCTKGKYYNGTKKACDTCKGSTKYCPGGTYNKNVSGDQGIYDCPAGGVANAMGDACDITLTKDMLVYGPGGKTTEYAKQCWNVHNRISDYIKCLFGGDNIQKKQD